MLLADVVHGEGNERMLCSYKSVSCVLYADTRSYHSSVPSYLPPTHGRELLLDAIYLCFWLFQRAHTVYDLGTYHMVLTL